MSRGPQSHSFWNPEHLPSNFRALFRCFISPQMYSIVCRSSASGNDTDRTMYVEPRCRVRPRGNQFFPTTFELVSSLAKNPIVSSGSKGKRTEAVPEKYHTSCKIRPADLSRCLTRRTTFVCTKSNSIS